MDIKIVITFLMLKSRFNDILKTFTKQEIKEFYDFVRSPAHNSNKNVIKLYESIRKHAPHFDSNLLGKDKLFVKLYPGKAYNDTVMRILLSDLIRLGEEFLIFKRSKRDSFGDELTLLEELRDRGLDSLYRTNYKNTLAKVQKMEDSRSKYFCLFELEIVNVEYHVRRYKQEQIGANVLERVENLIYFMLVEIVRNVHDLIINEKTYNTKYEFNIAFEFLDRFNFPGLLLLLKQHRPQHYSIINIYYNLLMALKHEENESYYDILRDSVLENFKHLSDNEKHSLFQYLESCCLNRMKYDINKYRIELFTLNNLLLEHNIYSYGTDVMTAQRFKNIFIAAVNLNKISWAETFKEKYLEKVQPEFRESMKFFTGSVLAFLDKNYSKALQEINKVKNDHFILKLDIKSWTLKIFYELKYFEQALSLIDTYRHFITRNPSISGHFNERHMNFIRSTSDLIKYMLNPRIQFLNSVEAEISKTGNILHKDWLLEKVKEHKT